MDAYHVKTFAEKPHKKLAKRFVLSGDFLWNAGMFFWKVETFMKSMQLHMPDLTDSLNQIAKKIKSGESFDTIWSFINSESIDYGLLEKAKNIYVIPGEFDWNDIGSWTALNEVLGKNKDGNIIRGNGKILRGKNNIIHSDKRFTAILGLTDVIVVNTEDATLIMHRDNVEDVKSLVKCLEESDNKNLI